MFSNDAGTTSTLQQQQRDLEMIHRMMKEFSPLDEALVDTMPTPPVSRCSPSWPSPEPTLLSVPSPKPPARREVYSSHSPREELMDQFLGTNYVYGKMPSFLPVPATGPSTYTGSYSPLDDLIGPPFIPGIPNTAAYSSPPPDFQVSLPPLDSTPPNNNEPPPQLQAQAKPYICPICPPWNPNGTEEHKAFTHPKDLRRHMRTHNTDPAKRFYCPVKGCKFATRGFNRNDHLVRHLERLH
ncbi:hypothetical protein K470DRAFT_254142 [Piedraia hortae CBS 480.64]|uniref:C2H2-type domain-containing protein n=1 Tax=Piedraia hortae CBS 480.64 TaxID=1314780 RepID=A0A6A7CAG4_9PEZI|nr:hypothetical protein K470DRAFT_254142 [Piedraia hortae CBS 480.64]